MVQDLAYSAMPIIQIKHQTDRRLRLLIWIKDDLPARAAHISHRHRPAEFASPGLGQTAFQHPCLEDMQFGFRHRSLQAEQQTVIVVRRIIHPIDVGDERIEQRANLKQLMPVPARPRQA